MTFTLNRKSCEKASLEFALRFEKTGVDRVQLYLISGITLEDEEPDYRTSVTGRYLSENAGHLDVLMNCCKWQRLFGPMCSLGQHFRQ